MYSNGNPIDGLPSKDNRKLTKEEKKALKQKQKEDEKRKKEEEKRKKEELKKKAKEEKEAKKRREKEEKEAKKSGDLSAVEKRKSVKDSLDAHTISRQGSSLSMSDGGVDSPRGGLGSSQSSVDKRSAVNGQGGGTPKLTRTKSGTSGALGKVQAKKGRRPAKFKEKEFQIILDNLRQNNRQDTELDLQNHYLDKWAAEDLAEVLMENRTVKMLNLSHNLIGDDGVVHLARMLEKNKTIHSFDISFNGLTRKGTRHMINCLNNNVFITELFMEEETIELGALGLGDAQLDAITPGMREEIDQILESNEGFQLLLAGKSDRLELPMREQCYINTHIIDRFPGLRKIDLSKNRLREIPKEIGTLKRLEELNLQENNITRIPVEIGELPSLEVLDLCRNSLVEIPLAIANLPRLRRLLLAGNRLDSIPLSSLGGMQALEFLDIRDNPLSLMSSHFKNIIDQGGHETLKFIKLQNEGSEEVSA